MQACYNINEVNLLQIFQEFPKGHLLIEWKFVN